MKNIRHIIIITTAILLQKAIIFAGIPGGELHASGSGDSIVSNSCPATVTDADANVYNTVQIGTQCWMRENIRASHYTDGTVIPETFFPDNNAGNAALYGRLYNWQAAMKGAAGSNAIPSGVQGVCPAGWHIPSAAEWETMINYLGGFTVAGGKLKEAGTNHWASPNTDATNESGFSALPGGGRTSGNVFIYFGDHSGWWLATETDADNARNPTLFFDNSGLYMGFLNKAYNLPVRCLKD